MKKHLKVLLVMGMVGLPILWWFGVGGQSNSKAELDSQYGDFSDVNESNSQDSEFQQQKKETTLLIPPVREQSSTSNSTQSDAPPSPPMSEEERESLTTMNFVEEIMKVQDETDVWEAPEANIEQD